LHELQEANESAWPFVQSWLREALNAIEVFHRPIQLGVKLSSPRKFRYNGRAIAEQLLEVR
jgi:hypothetical protein